MTPRSVTFLCIIALCLVGLRTAQGAILRVGTSWPGTQYATIEDAIGAAATSGDEIWVERGTYLLTSQINADKSVAIYAGFDGTETARDQRDWESNVTTLDGQNGIYHCLYITANATIDGFTITGGNANGSSYPDNCGGGIFSESSSLPTISNCIVSGNSAGWGGGIYNRDFSGPTLFNCTFSENDATTSGGGMYNGDASSPTVTDCTFSGNSAGWGGGIFSDVSSSPAIGSCEFSWNWAGKGGGGIYNSSSLPNIINCIFRGNSGYPGGVVGGMLNWSSSPNIINCIFVGNSASPGDKTGAIRNYDSSPIITNCTFSGNSRIAITGYAGIDNYDSSPIITNCIVWDSMGNDSGSSPTVTFTNILLGYAGEGNMDEDPLFVDVTDADPANWDLHLQPSSPCIDKGDSSAVPVHITTDFEGDPRICDGDDNGSDIVDMGADELCVGVCEGDFEPDGDVDGSDLAVFAADFGRTDCAGDCEGDFDGDNDVDGSDLAVFAADFGRTDCP